MSAFVVAAVVLVALPRSVPGQAEARRLAAEGRELVRQGKGSEALPKLKAAAALAPADVDLHRDYQNAMRAAGRLAEVLAEYEKRASFNPGDALSAYLLARLRPDDAEVAAAMRKVLGLDPGFAPAHRTLALIAGRTDEAEAARHYEICARSAGAEPDDLKALIAIAHRRGDPGAAAPWILRWREIAPDPEEGGLVTIPVWREGDARSITLGLSPRRGDATYALLLADAKRGSKLLAVTRRDGKWAWIDSGAWTPFGSAGPELRELLSGATGTLDSEPPYSDSFNRAMRQIRE